jgi:hypothetical protein
MGDNENDIEVELQFKVDLLNKIEEQIMSGNRIDINLNDDIADLCESFDNDYYETGTIKRNFKIDLNQLIEKAKPSNFGLGTETKYDPEVRNSLEIMACDLDPKFIETIKENINLNILVTHYELLPYKLVIYRTGAFFKQHKDTIRDPKHIGTVSCILTDNFHGGVFVIQHGNETKSFHGYDGHSNDYHKWIAIYGDVFHEVTKVTSGTRVSLLFDIYIKEENDTIEHLRSKINSSRASELIDLVNSKFEKNGIVVIGMFHEYSKAQLKAKDLKNTDKCIYEILKQYFNINIEILKYSDARYGDEVYLRNLLDTTGKLTDCYVSCNDSVYENKFFTKAIPYTGNDGGDSENLYLWGGFVITKKI